MTLQSTLRPTDKFATKSNVRSLSFKRERLFMLNEQCADVHERLRMDQRSASTECSEE